MGIRDNPKVTKLRLIAKKKEKEHKAKEEEELKARWVYRDAWFAYVEACKDEGYCAFCERTLDKCECIFMAQPQSIGRVTELFNEDRKWQRKTR